MCRGTTFQIDTDATAPASPFGPAAAAEGGAGADAEEECRPFSTAELRSLDVDREEFQVRIQDQSCPASCAVLGCRLAHAGQPSRLLCMWARSTDALLV